MYMYSTGRCTHLIYHVCMYFGVETYITRHISNIFDLISMTNDLRVLSNDHPKEHYLHNYYDYFSLDV